MWRSVVGLLAAVAACYAVGREFGLDNDEMLGYALASVGLAAASGVVAMIIFGASRLFRRR